MRKRVVDLTPEELAGLAAEAGRNAVRRSLSAGIAVAGDDQVTGQPVTILPDGRVESGLRRRASPGGRPTARRRVAGSG